MSIDILGTPIDSKKYKRMAQIGASSPPGHVIVNGATFMPKQLIIGVKAKGAASGYPNDVYVRSDNMYLSSGAYVTKLTSNAKAHNTSNSIDYSITATISNVVFTVTGVEFDIVLSATSTHASGWYILESYVYDVTLIG